jgi:hypothetical protein
MIAEHPVFQPPADQNISVWRYMNLSKFVWMLQHEALYFCRCDLLGDPYEGHYPKTLADGEDEFVRSMLANAQFGQIPNAEDVARSAFKAMLEQPKKIKEEMFVSCWHMNEEESSAMWKLYTSHDESICIRSTYQTLADGLPDACHLGQVKYIDYRRDRFEAGNLLNYIIHKRKSFEHEHEVRAVVWKFAGSDLPFEAVGSQGLVIPVNIQTLVHEIFVSPDSKPVFREIVQGLAARYGVTAQVKQSGANDPPDF